MVYVNIHHSFIYPKISSEVPSLLIVKFHVTNWVISKLEIKPHSKDLRIDMNELLHHARVIWGKDRENTRSIQLKDREFWDMFGAGVITVSYAWYLLRSNSLIPSLESMLYLLWTVIFLKGYAKELTIC